MKIKSKLRLGLGVLFLMILLLSLVTMRSINLLRADAGNILTDNYQSLEYSRKMLLLLDELPEKAGQLAPFEENLTLQKQNITEPGEAEVTRTLSDHYAALKINRNNPALLSLIRKDLTELVRLNMEGLRRKSAVATETASSANRWIAFTGTICFVIALTLLVNLPGNIANPIRDLTESIRQIAGQNYSERVHFGRKDEFEDLARSFNTMAEKLEEYNSSNLSKVLFEKKRIEALVNNMREPVIGLDAGGRVLFANQEALQVTGFDSGEMIGQAIADLATRNDLIRTLIHNSTDKSPLKIFANGKESYFEKEIVEISLTPTGETRPVQIGEVIVLKNITPFKELDFAKTNFIATVSHELKTPISSIKMGVQLLEKDRSGVLSEEQRQLLEGIKDDGNRLLKITGELLNMSQVETGNIQLNIQQSEPGSILRYALEAVRVQAEQRQIRLVTEEETGLPTVRADADKTAWVLINFLTNAIRYAPEKGTVHVSLKHTGQQVLFAVRDEGKGIDSRYTSRIFDRYFQVPGSAKTGTGLGLAISKEFIEAQGGSIGVESELGMGSKFYFRLSAEA